MFACVIMISPSGVKELTSCCEVLRIDKFSEASCPSSEFKETPLPSEMLCSNLCKFEEDCLSFTYNQKTGVCWGNLGELKMVRCQPGQPDDMLYVVRCKAAILGSSCNASTPCFVKDFMRCKDNVCDCERGHLPSLATQTCTRG